MISVLLWIGLQSKPDAKPDATPLATTATSAATSAANAQWESPRTSADVGEPFDATLVVRHWDGARVKLPDGALDGDTSWLVLGEPRLSAESSSLATRWTWELASLEPGERELPSFELVIARADGGTERATFEPTKMTFASVLRAKEDAPRAAREFRDAGPDESTTKTLWIAGVCGWLALIGALAWWWKRKRRSAVKPVVTALDRLAALERRDLEAPDAVRELHYDLTALLRDEFDARARTSRSSLTDDEWFIAASPELQSDVAVPLRDVFDASRSVKYGFAQPTHWAVRDTLQKAALALRTAVEPARSAA